MRERMNRLAKGIIETEELSMDIQPSAIEEEIRAGEKLKRELLAVVGNGLSGKGLVYSSNPRVKVLNSSFAGAKSHIAYEINGKYLEYGDVIEGAFYLVTNAGEKEVPYSFRVETGNSGKILSQLKEGRDFAALARRDYDLALRLFEFRDFTEAPFMQDIHIRAVYDGLHGKGNRFGQLEQFFIALGIKEPVRLSVEGLKREYCAPDGVIADVVEIKKKGWGYLPVSVKVEGDFLQSVKRTVTDEDFQGGVCSFPYEINPALLHRGKNYGSITVETMYEAIRVEVEAHGLPGKAKKREDRRYAGYLSLRLRYEAGREKDPALERRMEEELEQLRMSGADSALLSLLQGELMALLGRGGEAERYLSRCADEVYEKRMEHPGFYCLYEYASVLAKEDRERRDSLRRLLTKYVEEGKADYLLFFLYTRCDENWCFENPGEVLSHLKALYGEGCRSPFLYQQALEVWNQMPHLLYGIGTMELQVLNYGAKRGLVEEELAVKAARLSAVNKQYQPLCCRILKALYQAFPQKEILGAVCSLMIRGECRGAADFVWYERAVREELSLTRLYEYFLYSLPGDYKEAIPKQALMYFSYGHEMEQSSREALYENIIRYVSAESPLYQEYEREISRFAVEELLKSRINRRLAVIYEEMIYPDMVDSAIARVLPTVLRTYRIVCGNPQMRYVAVCCEEVAEEDVYPLQDGVAYVPIFSKEMVLFFQDAYGNRYTGISHRKTRILDKPELEKRCFELDPEHPMLLLSACREAMARETIGEEEKWVMEQALGQLRLHPLYRRQLTERLTGYYEEHAQEEAKLLPLLATDMQTLPKHQKNRLCEALVCHGCLEEACDMVKRFGCRLQPKSLQKLCSHMLSARLAGQEELLLDVAFEVYRENLADRSVLAHLCRYFNGACEQMYGVLLRSVKEQVETFDLEERLLGQMLFTGELGRIDKVFALYIARKKTDENLVRAYFTIKSAEYFLHDRPAPERVFASLEGLLENAMKRGGGPDIWLLALIRYYSEQPKLTAKQQRLCQSMVDDCLEKGMIFPCFKQLAGQVRIPEEIRDKAMIQYVGSKDLKPELKLRILPGEESFHREEWKRAWQGIFVKQKMLFEGEIMEYEIYEQRGGEKALVKEGSVACALQDPADQSSRFSLLNQMSLCFSLKEEEGLRGAMEEYVKKTAAAEALFELL